MFAKLTALVGGGYTFPYNVEDAYPSAWGQWSHHQGASKDDGSPVSVFKISSTDPNDRKLVAARNGVKRLKMLRHPNILAYKDSAETTEKGATVIYLVTQPVKPLKLVIEELALQGQHRDEYLAMGILHMTNAVSFLNNDCKLIHGNICLDAVVVTDTLDWKLHGFDLLSEQALPGDHCLQHASWMVGVQYKPAELGKSDWAAVQQSPPWAVDAWGLGCLMQEVFSGEYMGSVENLRRTDIIPPALLGDYQKLLSSAPSRRLNPSKVAESKFLNNRVVDVVAFMENISVKDSLDKESFFKKLPQALPSIPPAVAVRKILPLLSHALEFGGAPAQAVSSLLLIGNQLSSDEFNKRVVPCLSKMFASTDRTLRRSLLESIDTYGQHLTTAVLEEQIYPNLQNGFTDTNAYIRELTLKSMLTLAPKMTNKTLTQQVLKHLSKLQVDEEASIRANTTVLLGNLSRYLGEATCKRVLLNAFTRALKDTFPPAKIAGLRAMVATSQYHGAEDAALRILPAVAPLAIDPIGEVRQAALQVLESFTKVLKDADAKRQAEAAASGEQPAGMGAALGAGGAGVSLGAGSAMAAGSVLNWAVSSLMSSTGLAVKAAPAAAAASAPPAEAGPARPAAPAAPRPSVPSAPTRPSAQPAPAPAASTSAAAPARPAAVLATSSSMGGSADGWGDGDGWDEEDVQVDEDEQRARSRLASIASTSKPAATSAPARPSTQSDGWASGGLGDDGDEAWQDMDKPAAPVVPRARSGAGTRPVGSGSSGGGAAGAAAKPKGGMKLGVQKLGAQKITTNITTNLVLE